MREHDFEPVRGLPADLPEGETILWQGRPSARRLAFDAFHIRAVAAYFAVMMAWGVLAALGDHRSTGAALATALSAIPIALAGLGLLAVLAVLNSRTTVYTITNRRVVLRFGAAFSKAINVPFTVVEGASLKAHADGSGDLALALRAPNKIALLHLWPHARPWKLAHPEPTLRGIADAAQAGAVLARAMAERGHAASPALASAPALASPALASLGETSMADAALAGAAA